MKKVFSITLSLLLIFALLSGCTAKTEPSSDGKEEPPTEVAKNPLTDFEYNSLAQTKETFGQGVNEFTDGDNKLVTYDGPENLLTVDEVEANLTTEISHRKFISKSVDTKISVNGHDLFVYETGVADGHTWVGDGKPPQVYTPITYFDFEGEAKVEIDVSAATDVAEIEKVAISPLSKGVEAKIDGQKISFTIKEHGDYTVVFNDDVTNAIHIFASEIEKYEPKDDDLIIGPGEWYLSNISLEDGQTLYICGGAVVHSKIVCDKITEGSIKGRGILDGGHYKTHNEAGSQGAMVPISLSYCSDMLVEGIIITNPNCWVLNGLECSDSTIDNVHIISARNNGDGITLQDCQHMKVKNCFVRSWDDSLVVKNYTATNSKDIEFKNISIWTDLAQSMEIGYETNKGLAKNSEISEISFKDITVIYNWHKPVISIHNADDALVHDITYKDITVENANMGKGDGGGNSQLIDFNTAYSGNWSHTPDRGNIRDILVEDVTVLATDNIVIPSRIQGTSEDSTVEDITIRNLVILGTKITKENKDEEIHKFIVKEPYAKNVKFE
jgi:hypothetical protein